MAFKNMKKGTRVQTLHHHPHTQKQHNRQTHMSNHSTKHFANQVPMKQNGTPLFLEGVHHRFEMATLSVVASILVAQDLVIVVQSKVQRRICRWRLQRGR